MYSFNPGLSMCPGASVSSLGVRILSICRWIFLSMRCAKKSPDRTLGGLVMSVQKEPKDTGILPLMRMLIMAHG